MKQQIELVKYPLVIEPAVNVLEVLVRRNFPEVPGDSTKTSWSTFCRLPSLWNYPFSIDNSTPHLFGNSQQLAQCNLVLGYGPSGDIAAIFYRNGEDWVSELFPEEVSGAVSTFPSLRVVFANEDELEEFLKLLTYLTIPTRPSETILVKGSKMIRNALRNMRLISVAPLPTSDVEGPLL